MEYYNILGVSKTATQDEIKKAYRKLVMEHHPDKGGDINKFTKVQEAYEVLSNPSKRQEYDSPQAARYSSYTTFSENFGEPFEEFFANFYKKEFRNQKQIFRTVVHIGLAEAYNGGTVTIHVATPNGASPVQIKIPKGIFHGSQIRYENVIDANTTLIVTFAINNRTKFERVDDHLYCEVKVSVLDLIVGTTIEFDTISGKKISVNIPPKTQPNQKVRVAGHGMPIGETGLYGDQFLLINAFIPDNVNQDVIEAILKSKQP